METTRETTVAPPTPTTIAGCHTVLRLTLLAGFPEFSAQVFHTLRTEENEGVSPAKLVAQLSIFRRKASQPRRPLARVSRPCASLARVLRSTVGVPNFPPPRASAGFSWWYCGWPHSTSPGERRLLLRYSVHVQDRTQSRRQRVQINVACILTTHPTFHISLVKGKEEDTCGLRDAGQSKDSRRI